MLAHCDFNVAISFFISVTGIQLRTPIWGNVSIWIVAQNTGRIILLVSKIFIVVVLVQRFHILMSSPDLLRVQQKEN